MTKYAYPIKSSFAPDENGLTKRELFAAMAMQGLISNNMDTGTFREQAQLAVKNADALLRELEKGEPK